MLRAVEMAGNPCTAREMIANPTPKADTYDERYRILKSTRVLGFSSSESLFRDSEDLSL